MDKATFWRAFDEAHPSILGAFLDAVVAGLRGVDMASSPANRGWRTLRGLGGRDGAGVSVGGQFFLQVYAGDREMADDVVLDGDQLATLVRSLGDWEGTATELLGLLNLQVPEETRRQKTWYQRGRQVSDHLRRLAPTLRRVGTEVILDPKNRRAHSGARLMTIKKVGAAASPASPASPDQRNQADSGHAPGNRWPAA